ncbi:MAG: GGDEF domain-containing phosphodiesterase [Ilumatobacteraceae bacterium]
MSIGVASAPSHGGTTSDLLRNANAALYRANAGRNRVELFDRDMHEQLQATLDAEQSLRRAIDDGEILPFFQPEIDAATGRVIGAELLARWLRPDGTVATANEFIAIAKKAGLLERLTERVLNQARPDIRRLASFGLPDGFRFRVNLAPSSTDRSWRDDPIDELIRGIDPSLITVDVREAAVVADLPTAAATLASFRARGGRVCLDDFARGVSSLSLLRKLPVDEVRIDRQSIDSITAHPHDRAIVRSIISVVREIGLQVTSEGVETGAQADALIAPRLHPPAGSPLREGHAGRAVRAVPHPPPGRGVRVDGAPGARVVDRRPRTLTTPA